MKAKWFVVVLILATGGAWWYGQKQAPFSPNDEHPVIGISDPDLVAICRQLGDTEKKQQQGLLNMQEIIVALQRLRELSKMSYERRRGARCRLDPTSEDKITWPMDEDWALQAKVEELRKLLFE